MTIENDPIPEMMDKIQKRSDLFVMSLDHRTLLQRLKDKLEFLKQYSKGLDRTRRDFLEKIFEEENYL